MKQEMDIFLIQEHWLFHCELNMLSEIHDEIAGSSKAVDSDDPMSASYMPRGYGGVAILWNKAIDKYIKPISDGSNRIQCVELLTSKPAILMSVYLPTKSTTDSKIIFDDCIDQLYQIVQKYKGTDEIVIGGDFNEDIVKEKNNSKRKIALLEFLKECKLTTNHKGPTFINTSGADISEIDYFLHSNIDLQPSKRITDHPVNVSDHHPILLQIECYRTQHAEQTSNNQKPKIKWEKLHKQNYTDIISKEIIRYTHMLEDDNLKKVSKQKTYGKNKLKLNIWNKEIADALKANKQAYKIWKDNGRPMNIDHPLIIEKKLTRKIFRAEIRNEELRRKHNERNTLIHSNSGDKNLFYKLIRKQRQNGNTFINDLNVDGETFERDNILSGWHTHFSKLAVPT
ncbi:unnamed protein product [Mytilus coruscus]|uniref:Endonuclease/exonuclease/phosphatase domain-containing protein n=1 Tax=Mytilus coruscus TaxID=42192 RepID=A0A6J8AFZ7_MYTCO|nr:unnamed protein product [Mytilus coruscus]